MFVTRQVHIVGPFTGRRSFVILLYGIFILSMLLSHPHGV
jgi:hypothetical protein